MDLLFWILVGSGVGWLGGSSRTGKGYRPSMDVVMSIAGALGGGLLMHATSPSGYREILAAISCSVLFMILTGLVRARRISVQ